MIEEMQPDPGAARITGRAPALRPSVPLYRHMLYGTGLTNALDFLVLSHIHFMCEDGKDFSVDDVVTALRAEGILSANGKGLIGSKAVYESIARLRAAGFLHRTQDNGGSFGKVSYTFYEFPASNPHWTPPGVSVSGSNDPLLLSGEAGSPLLASNHVSAGQTASPDKARADKARADRRSGKQHVSAGQTASPDRRSGKPSPPHPPEEEVTPPPPTPSNPSASLPSQREEEPPFSPEEKAAAAEFLQTMRTWQAGRATAVKNSALLLRTMRQQGWPVITGMDGEIRELLEREIFKDTTGALSYARLLPGWLRDLRRFALVRPKDTQRSGAGNAAAVRAALIAACGRCDELGWVLDDDDDGPNVRCTHPGVSTGTEASR